MILFQRDSSFALFFTLLYALLLAWAMGFHELWFDETEPWLLGLYSNSYADLLQNKRFEGHPNLWYSILFVITKFTHNLKALQITQAVFAITFVYLFLRFAPFSKALRLMFCFGYYGLFEYGIISRLYAIELATVFLVCALYPKRFSHWYLYILLLGILAQTNLFGFFMAGVLGLLLFSEAFRIWRQSPHWVPVSAVHKTIGLLIWAACCLYSFLSMVRPNETQGSLFSFFHPYYFYQAIARIWQAFAPVPNFITEFWNTSFLRISVEIPLSALLVILLYAVFHRISRLLIALLLLFSAMLFLFFLKMEGSMRHHGHFFTFTIVLLWLRTFYEQSPKQKRNPGWINITLFASLYIFGFLQIVAGMYALYTDWESPFYTGKEVAQYLKSLPTSYKFATDEGVISSNVIAYLGYPLVNLTTGNLKSFYTLDSSENHYLHPNLLFDRASKLAHEKNSPVVLISRSDLPYQLSPIPVEFLRCFGRNSITGFTIFTYKINPLPISKKYMVAEHPAIGK
ncbi:hypothetical protein [Sabulibacter ruber]|uniref:hypothetical protein n=1 Tax=Sabulibacter ruber TaxID=2811901 RepID=UPI001A96D6D2|nr:hypothetical protein [Sabulibacter ruber]